MSERTALWSMTLWGSALWGIALVLGLGACSSPRDRTPDIAKIYGQAALEEVRNPVIVMHGILGANLRQRSTDKMVWGAFSGRSADPATPEGARAIALPLSVPSSAFDYDPSKADVYASGPLEKLELTVLYQLMWVSIYADIIRVLGAGGYRDPVVFSPKELKYADDHFTCFTFFYDWRRDNVENAILFGRFIDEKRVEIAGNAASKIDRLRAEGTEDALATAKRIGDWLEEGYRFDVVAHSMGGLIARYYARYGAKELPGDGGDPVVTWAGSEEIDRLVLVGTPNLGSMGAFENLTDGFAPGPFLPVYDEVILATMPSVYQLLPRVRHDLVVDAGGESLELDFTDPVVWEENGWGLFSERARQTLKWLVPEAKTEDELLARAREYTGWALERAQRFQRALDSTSGGRSPSYLSLFAADAEPTLVKVRMREDESRLVPVFRGEGLMGEGDGSVPRYSALGDERQGAKQYERLRSSVAWNHVTFLSDDHIGLTSNPHFVDNMLFMLLEMVWDRPGQKPGAGMKLPALRPTSRSTGR